MERGSARSMDRQPYQKPGPEGGNRAARIRHSHLHAARAKRDMAKGIWNGVVTL
eukprot:SAG31_NODE_183_length_20987_cov_8.711078_3_plen_54_part_00